MCMVLCCKNVVLFLRSIMHDGLVEAEDLATLQPAIEHQSPIRSVNLIIIYGTLHFL
jgi:hypothetical protein